MIYLFTGGPGAGKTANMVNELADIVKDRPLFSYNVNGLKLPHTELASLDNWMTDCPDGSVIVIDEVQKFWRPAGSGAKVPEAIQALETHRHRGIDFYMTTQGPHLMHANVRALVFRHVHLRDVGILGRYWYEWPECNDTPRTSWKNAPIKKRFKLPKRAFDLYTSSSMHIKPVYGIPRSLIYASVAIAGCGYLGYNLYKSIAPKLAGTPTNVVVQPDGKGGVVNTSVKNINFAPDERIDFIPRISGRPWTAPAYDHLRQVVAMPNIQSAICVDDDCKCYAPGMMLIDMPPKDCKIWARDKPFNPYAVPDQGRSAQQNTQPGSQPSNTHISPFAATPVQPVS